MTGDALEGLESGWDDALVELAGRDPGLRVVDAGPPGSLSRLAEKFPDRVVREPLDGPGAIERAAGLARPGHCIYVRTDALSAAGAAYLPIRRTLCAGRANVKVVAVPSEGSAELPTMLEDVAMMRGLPGMTVAVPADAPTARSATLALAAFDGPAYLRLSSGPSPVVGDGRFELGRAPQLRAGSDLAVVANGPMVARALGLSEELAKVGLHVRVLDFASMKPFDEKALLAAARETGAILTMEAQSVVGGLGALVAAVTADSHPVPVRRLGVPDVFARPDAGPGGLDRYGLSAERAMEEAWELLKLRGKVQ